MVAIFVGAGSGFERSSANLLGGAGQLGGGLIGRGGENVSVNAFSGNLLLNHQDEYLVGRGPDVGISRTYNSLASEADGDNGDQWQQSTHRRAFGLTGTLGTAGSTISRLGGDGAVLVYSWDDTAGAYISKEGAGAHDRLSHSGGEWTWTDGDSQITETYSAHGTDNWRITAKTDRDGNALTFTYTGDKLDKVTTADGGWTQYVWAGNNIAEIVTGYTDFTTSTAETLTRTRYAYDGSNRLVSVITDLTPEDNSVADAATYVTTYTYDGASNRIASIAQTDGSLITITYDVGGRVETLTQAVASGVTRTTSISYAANHTLVTGPDGQVTKLSYDAQGRLTGIELPPASAGAIAQTVAFSYDADGNLASVTDGEGETTTYQYDAGGNAILVTDANNNTIERTFDAGNRLVTERLLGSDKHNSSAAHYSQYVYDAEGHLRYAIDASGAVMEYEYSAAGELVREIAYPAHKFDVGATALTEAGMDAWVAGLGDLSSVKIVEHTYDARGGRVSTTSYSIADSAGQALTGSAFRAIYQTFDQAGRLVATHRESQATQSYLYDGMGRLIASTDLHGGTTNIAFNDAGLQTTVTTASGYVSVSVFNQAGELVSLAESGTFLGGGTSTYGYDENGRMRVATDASGRLSYFVHDKAGRKVADIDHLGGMVEYIYDQADRIVATVQRANAVSPASLTLLADPENGLELASFAPAASAEDQWSFNIYDDAGRTIRSIDGEGGVAAFEYDQSDRLVRTTYFANTLSTAALDALKLDPLGSFTDPAAHADDAVSRLFYDEAGRLVGALDGEGYLTESVYDAAGQKIADIAYSAKASGDLTNAVFGELRASVDASQIRVTRYIYDGQGQLAYTLDALGGLTSYSYDAAGNLVSQTRHAHPVVPVSFDITGIRAAFIDGPADRTSWSVYDDAGRLAYSLDAEGGVTGFAYDTSGRMIKSVQFDNLHGAVSSLPTLSAMEAWAADSAQAGDAANRVTRNWYNERGDVIYTVDAESYVKGYTYDEVGRLLSESAWPEKVVVGDATTTAQVASLAAAANSSGDLIVLRYSYDGAGRLLISTDGADIETRYVYDAMGQRTDAYQADNVPGETVRTHYVYDNAGRLTEQHSDYDPGNPSAIDATVTYAYDGLGNRVSVTDPNGNTTSFAYDALGQVVQSTNALNGVTTYQYDAFGNVVKTTDPRGEHTYLYYDRLGRLVAERDAEDYLTYTTYNRFGEVTYNARFSAHMTDPAELGIPVFIGGDTSADPVANALQLQGLADQTDAAAGTAEAASTQAVIDAADAAQAAIDADALVDSIEAQIAALGGGGAIDFEAERMAALADMNGWLSVRKAWLDDAKDSVGDINGANGLERDHLEYYENAYSEERRVADDLGKASATAANKAAYINQYYDNLTWQANNLGSDRTAALADPLAWLTARRTDLVNWITSLLSLSGSSNLDEASDEFQEIWRDVFSAIYDLQNNTYSTGWPNQNEDVFFSNVQNNPSYLPGNINHTTQQAVGHRATILINAYFDVIDATGGEYEGGGGSQLSQLQAQLAVAEADAAAAHTASDQAQIDAIDAAALATALRTDADAAQAAADAAWAVAAQNGVTSTEGLIILDLTALGAPARTFLTYDRLGRLEQKVDAGGYVETYEYNAFSQLVSTSRYEDSVYTGGGSAPLDPAVIAAYDAYEVLQDEADQLDVTASLKESNAATLQGEAAAKRTLANQALAARNTAQQNLNSLPSLQSRFNSYWSALSASAANIQVEIDSLTVQIDYYYQMAQNDPGNAQWYAIMSYPLEQQRNDLQVQKTIINVALANQSSYSVGDDLPYISYASNAWNAYNELRIDRAEAQDALATATAAYNAADNVADAAELAAANALTQAVAARNAADAKQQDADAALLYAEQLELSIGEGTTSFTLPSFNVGDLGEDATTLFEYDNRGQLTRSTDAEGHFESFGYDAFGRRISAVAKSTTGAAVAGGTTIYSYDKRGLLVSETLPITSFGQGGGFVQNTYDYDARGNLIERIEAANKSESRATTYVYDNLDRLIETRRDSVSAIKINAGTKAVASDSGIPTEIVTYDANGNVIKTVDAGGGVTVAYYDALDRKAVEIGPEGTYTSYQYDANGNVTSIRVYDQLRTGSYNGGAASQAPNPPGSSYRSTSFAYDDLGRMVSSTVHGVDTGELTGSEWGLTSDGALDTFYTYDAFGNVVRMTEPSGSVTRSYYDDLGRKIAQLDGEQYLTEWTYDSEGNVLSETRHANKATGAIGGNRPPTVASDPENDRITAYTYDKVGNRKTETRTAVKVHNGQGGYTVQSAIISYTYNGLGQVLTKTEASGDVFQFVYDAGGRLQREIRPTFSGFLNGSTANLSPELLYEYDGLGNLVQTTQTGTTGSPARVTSYSYGAGGRLSSMTDADGNTRSYQYDRAGRLVLESWVRGSAEEGIGYRYDKAGRNTGHAYYLKPGATWAFQSANEYTTIGYNSHGDVIGVAFNRTDSQINSLGYQQQNKVDAAGRVWATNAGDGIWKYFGYDKNGNQTLTVASAGRNLAGLNSIGAAWALKGEADVNATLIEYDDRNLAVRILEEGRQLSGTQTANIVTTRGYNAFREVASETDALSNTTNFTYNTMGRLIERKSPQVSITTQSGAVQNVRPTENFFHDASGRLIARADANGNLTKLTLLAGSGYGGSEALVALEQHADGGTVTTQFDVHGDARKITESLTGSASRVTLQNFDDLGRVEQIVHAGGLTDNYTYDLNGNRLSHWNNVIGSGDKELYQYDIQGRQTSFRSFGGDVTTTSYQWNASLSSALGAFGGWNATVSTEADRVSTSDNIIAAVTRTDLFGRVISYVDKGGFTYTNAYDQGGRITSGGGATYQYYNTGLVKQKHTGDSAPVTDPQTGFVSRYNTKTVEYSYDILGRVKTERLEHTIQTMVGMVVTPGGIPVEGIYEYEGGVLQDSSVDYDALGRITRYRDGIAKATPDVDKRWTYDANGNVRSITTTYKAMNANGSLGTGTTTKAHWYAYDSMNRVVISKGSLSGGSIVRGAEGVQMSYNHAGQRMTSQTGSGAVETYLYNAAGLVTQVTIGSTVRVQTSFDQLGRVLGHVEKDAAGNVVYERYGIVYNSRGQVLAEKARQKQDADTVYSHTVNSFSDNGQGTAINGIAGSGTTGSSTGAMLHHSYTKYWLNGSASPVYGSTADNDHDDTKSQYVYAWSDPSGAGGVKQTGHRLENEHGLTWSYTQYDREGNAELTFREQNNSYNQYEDVRFFTDASGQIIERREKMPSGVSSGNLPATHTYRLAGREMGEVSNNGTVNVDYATLIGRRDDTGTGRFLGGSTTATLHADFDANHVTLAGGAQGDAPGSYTVQGGESLQAVALAVWGDASLWYKIAEANGLSGNAPLQAGQRLTIPGAVANIHHTAETFRPYDPARAMGDVGPPAAQPPKHDDGCGLFGQILLVAVAVAVTIATKGALSKLFSGPLSAVLGGASAAAAGSVASQTVGVATGLQQNFSFKGVALAAIGGGVGGALGKFNLFGAGDLGKVTNLANDVARGALASGITQGIGAATGLQNGFSWAGVAAAGAAAGIGGAVTRGLGSENGLFGIRSGSEFVTDVASTGASAIAYAATRSAIEGTSFGDNLQAAIPDVIGQAIGRAVAGAVNSGIAKEAKARADVDERPVEAGGSRGAVAGGLLLISSLGLSRAIGDFVQEYIEPLWADAEQTYDEILVRADRIRMDVQGSLDSLVADFDNVLDFVIRSTVGNPAVEQSAAQVSRFGQAFLASHGRYEMQIAQNQAAAAQAMWEPISEWGSRATGPAAWQTNISPEMLEGAYMAHALGAGPNPLDTYYHKAPLTNWQKVGAGIEIGTAALPLASMGSKLTIGALARTARPAAGLAAPASAEFVGPLIGKSGFRTSGEFAEAVGARYQGFVEAAHPVALRAEARGLLSGNPHTRIGTAVDRASAQDLSAWLRSEGISEGPNSLIQINRWLRDPAGSGLYVRPDVRVPAAGRIFDATIGFKPYDSTQITRFGAYSGGDYITVVRPGPVGGSYSIVP